MGAEVDNLERFLSRAAISVLISINRILNNTAG